MIVYIGIDWSQQKHDVVFMNEEGGTILHKVIKHTPEGFYELDAECQKLGLPREKCVVGMETSYNLLMDFLETSGYEQIYVIPPTMVKNSRGRYGVSKAHTDQSDARLIADILRTDQGRLHQWQPDSLLTQQIKAQVSLIRYLTKNITQTTNRLRAVLLRYYPQATRVFSSLNTLIGLKFIQTYPTPQDASQLTFEAFKSFAKQNHYSRPNNLPVCFARLIQCQSMTNPSIITIFQDQAVLLARLLADMIHTKNKALRELKKLFICHPDHAVFSSLPGAGNFLAPALLAKFGDDRQRFSSPQAIQAIAGTCPVTKASGKSKRVIFRRHCDKEFRTVTQQWAIESLRVSVWANTYFQAVRPHCKSASHAYRCLANRWLGIAWKIWQDRVSYDEEYHLRQRALRTKPRL